MTFDRPKLERLKKAMAMARARSSETFIFDGREILCDYAKYMIEYLESVIPPDRGSMNGYGAAKVRWVTCPDCEADFPRAARFPEHTFLGRRCEMSGQPMESGGSMNGYGAGRIGARYDLEGRLAEFGFDSRNGNFWTREWASSRVSVSILGDAVHLAWHERPNGSLLEVASFELPEHERDAVESLETFMMEADFFDQHGRRRPRGRTLNRFR